MTNPLKDERIFNAAFDLALERGWHNVSLAEIAQRSGFELNDLVSRFPSKAKLLHGYSLTIDKAMMAATPDPTLGTEARLKAALMARFQAMAPHRSALCNMFRHSRDDIASLGLGVSQLYQSMGLALESAAVPSSGLKGIARTHALAAAYLYALKQFFNDASGDLAPSAAALDKALGKAMRYAPKLWPPGAARDASNAPLPYT